MLFPLPTDLIRAFAASVDKLYVIEELDPIIETHVRALGIDCQGKELFFTDRRVHGGRYPRKLLGTPNETAFAAEDVPVRPPVLCPAARTEAFSMC